MDYWIPEKIFDGQCAYIIGGGPSLRSFQYWEFLKTQNVVGTNSAFRLGKDVCPICVFVDTKFWNHFRGDMEEAADQIFVTSNESVRHFYMKQEEEEGIPIPENFRFMNRQERGLGTGSTLGLNRNCGAAALNLALSMGSGINYLLGFDMKLDKSMKANWHDYRIEPENAGVYQYFIRAFQDVVRDLKLRFPLTCVFNVTDNSDLPQFQKIGVDEHFAPLMENEDDGTNDV